MVEINFLMLKQLFPSLTERFSIKKMIATSERHAKHPFAGQNRLQRKGLGPLGDNLVCVEWCISEGGQCKLVLAVCVSIVVWCR